jgi:hypothetical protein
MIGIFDKLINSRMFTIIFTLISADPSPAKAWINLYNNIYFRLIFIYIIIYQTIDNSLQSILFTLSTIGFFYLIGDKKEREMYLSNNLNKEDMKTFIYLIIFCIYLNEISKINIKII